eukprot:4516188-Amphidinium_carterae.1
MAGENTYHQISRSSAEEPSVALPLTLGQVSLPTHAATVDLLSPEVLPPRLAAYLDHPDVLQKDEAELTGRRPQMHFDVHPWPQLASDLWECGVTRWVPTDWVPRVRGAIKRAGLFGVPKSSGDRLRLIIDRRPANWAERNLRELLLADVVQEKVSFSEFEQLWKLMSLPHPSILQDIFLGRKGYLQVTAEDCSDYFYMLRLPPHQHYHTALVWSLERMEIAESQLRADLADADIEAAASFTPLLKVVPMGDRKSMELAQAVHQYIHLRAGSLESSAQLTHGWPLPGQCSIWGSYCDDLALVDLLHRHLTGAHCKKLVKKASADRL